jgi:hypothetical protein
MMFRLSTVVFLLLASTACVSGHAQSTEASPDPPAKPPPLAQITFDFDRPGLPVPHFTLSLDEQGKGTYIADKVLHVVGSRDTDPTQNQHVERSIALTPATTAKIFAAAHDLDNFRATCASSLKNIADSGAKTLTYTAPAGATLGTDGSCRYHYSENKTVVMLTDLFESIEFTLDMGGRLDFDRRFDRLGLDTDMTQLVNAIEEGRAAEIGTIAHTLRALAQDPDIMDRVRLHATSLLQRFPPPA